MRAASHGYAVVIQDTRGRFASEGQFYPFLNEMDDGYDTVEWCASQPWSTGKVGMFGRSYVGATQWLAALARPPSLAAIVPGITASDYHEGWTYQGGALQWGFAVSWTLSQLTLANLDAIARDVEMAPNVANRLTAAIDGMEETFQSTPVKEFPYLKDGLAPYFYDWLSHPAADGYWERWRIEDHHDRIMVPALHMGGWYDIFLKGTLRNFQGMRKNGPTEEVRNGQKLLVGPWRHAAPLAEVSGEAHFGLMANESAIDLQGMHLRWYDHWLKGIDDGIMAEAPVRIFVMGANLWRSEQEWPLARTRYVDYYLHSAGSAPDTDFTAKLVDVCPCGCARSLIDGIIRARYRESLATPSPIQPGQVYQYTIDLVATSNVFKAGHRIRVEISSSNFPRFDRNPNTGREPWEETDPAPALQTVYHSPEYPSHITLPIIPAS